MHTYKAGDGTPYFQKALDIANRGAGKRQHGLGRVLTDFVFTRSID